MRTTPHSMHVAVTCSGPLDVTRIADELTCSLRGRRRRGDRRVGHEQRRAASRHSHRQAPALRHGLRLIRSDLCRCRPGRTPDRVVARPIEESVPSVYILPDQQLVECGTAEAVLRAALRAGVPFAHACGGHASCSTCRVVVVEGWAACGERTAKERVIAERLGFGPEFRLACQTRISAPVTMRRLVLDDTDRDLADIRPRSATAARGRRAGCSAAGVGSGPGRSARTSAWRSCSPTSGVSRPSPRRCCRMTCCTCCNAISVT